MRRFFIIVCIIALLLRSPHHESATLYGDHLERDATYSIGKLVIINILTTIHGLTVFCLKHQPEADVADPVDRYEPEAVRYAAVPRKDAPTAAPVHTDRAGSRAGRVGLRCGWIISKPIMTPFPHVAAHVIKPQFVGLLLANRMRLAATIRTIPRHLVYIVAATVFVTFALLATPGGIFPLRLRRQAERFAR